MENKTILTGDELNALRVRLSDIRAVVERAMYQIEYTTWHTEARQQWMKAYPDILVLGDYIIIKTK